MAFEQHIPFYIHKFKDHPWNVFETGHYVFHVEPDSLAEREIDLIKERQESAYTKIVETLELEASGKKIAYYFYSSREKKKELVGDDWYGQSIYEEFTVHAVYNEEDKVVGEHEDTHLLSLPMGLPISLFQEGLAEFLVGSSMFGHEHNSVVWEGMEKGLAPDLENLMSKEGWLNTPDEEAEFYYSVAGSFISHLFGNLGLNSFKKLYAQMERGNSQEENLRIFEHIVGKSLREVESNWRQQIIPRGESN